MANEGAVAPQREAVANEDEGEDDDDEYDAERDEDDDASGNTSDDQDEQHSDAAPALPSDSEFINESQKKRD